MEWRSPPVYEDFIEQLRAAKNQEPPIWDDQARGIFLTLIENQPLVWNARSYNSKDDIMLAIKNISTILINIDPRFNVWAVLEKWCWMVEIFVRSTTVPNNLDWRYNRNLHFLKFLSKPSYPFMRCLSLPRLIALTEKYEESCITIIEKSEALWSSAAENMDAGIFQAELAFYCGETDETHMNEVVVIPRAVQPNAPKRRGRPPKQTSAEKINDVQSTSRAPTTSPAGSEDNDEFDHLGFSMEMYDELIPLVESQPVLWNPWPLQPEIKEEYRKAIRWVAERAIALFARIVTDKSKLKKISCSTVSEAWEGVKRRYYHEKSKGGATQWIFFPKLHFLPSVGMPALMYDSAHLSKNNDPTTSCVPKLETEENETASTSSIMASSSTKSMLDSLVAEQMKHAASSSAAIENVESIISADAFTPNTATLNELQKLWLRQVAPLNLQDNSAPPAKKMRSDSPPVTQNSTSRLVLTANKNNADTTISTWVPPKEEVSVGSLVTTKNETPTPKRSPTNTTPTASAAAKANAALIEKNFRKIQQTMGPFSNLPTTRNSMINMSSLAMQNPAVAQALFSPKVDNITMMPNAIHTSVPGDLNGKMVATTTATGYMQPPMSIAVQKPNTEDKWTSLGTMIACTGREIESRDAILACNLIKDIQDLMYKYNMKSLTSPNKK